MKNGIFTLDWASVADAVLTAVVTAVFIALYGIVTAPGFDVVAVDWTVLGHQMLNIAIVAGFISLGKDFLSTNNGSLLGMTPGYSAPLG